MLPKTSSKNLTVECAVPHGCQLGEGPVWDARQKSIRWVDILRGEIHEYYPHQNRHRIQTTNEMVGAVALCSDGNFLAALHNGLAIINRDTGGIDRLIHPEAHVPGNRYNEGKCDPIGRFWVGTMSLSEQEGAGSLYRIEKDLSYSRQLQGITISNGMAWSTDRQTFYYIDTPTFAVAGYDFDPVTGSISRKRVVITIPKEDGFPDGMTIDREGNLWIAHWDGWQVTRWDPATGEKLLSIPLPVARVTSCTFGGDTLQDLYITSASTGLSEQELEKQAFAGALFVVRNSGFQGLAAVEFDCLKTK